MAEETKEHMSNFIRKGFLWQISTGHVLVKQNKWGNNGKIRAVVKYLYDTEVTEERKPLRSLSNNELKQEQKNDERTPQEIEMIEREIAYRKHLWARQSTDEELVSARNDTRSQERRNLIDAEIQYRRNRRANNLSIEELQRDEELQNYKLTFAHKQVVKNFETKNGARIVWPWESGIVLSIGEIQVKTPDMAVDTIDEQRLTINADYVYRITDPELFAVLVNQKKGVSGAERFMGDQLDKIVRDYARTVTYDEFRKNDSDTLQSKLQSKIAKEERNMGVKITRLSLGKVDLPEAIVAAKAKEVALEEQRKENAVERDRNINQLQSYIEILEKLGFPPGSYTLQELSGLVATLGKGNAAILLGAGNSSEATAALATMLHKNPNPTAPNDGDEATNDEKKKTR